MDAYDCILIHSTLGSLYIGGLFLISSSVRIFVHLSTFTSSDGPFACESLLTSSAHMPL